MLLLFERKLVKEVVEGRLFALAVLIVEEFQVELFSVLDVVIFFDHFFCLANRHWYYDFDRANKFLVEPTG